MDAFLLTVYARFIEFNKSNYILRKRNLFVDCDKRVKYKLVDKNVYGTNKLVNRFSPV